MEALHIFIAIFVGCVTFQLYLSVIAKNMGARMLEQGYVMQAGVFWSTTTLTDFWSEAKEKNRELNDSYIRNNSCQALHSALTL
jgi:hypothetical protein